MKIKSTFIYFSFLLFALLGMYSFVNGSSQQEKSKTDPSEKQYATKQVILVVMDGPRYSETWGDSSHQYIPRMANQLAPKGIVNTRFYNNGPTLTNPGHTAMCTGNYQNVNNFGKELPSYPSIFQHWLKQYSKDATAAWIIASKDKLAVLANCTKSDWKGQCSPSTNCGKNGLGSGYREDSITFNKSMQLLTEFHPKLALINFKEPDMSAHRHNWPDYLKGIQEVDEYIYQIWNFIETDSIYKGTTTLFVTNDHGRHLDSVSVGFNNHGDDCEGCRHINFYAFGPDFKENIILDTPRELIDIPATIAELMHFSMPDAKGLVMDGLFK